MASPGFGVITGATRAEAQRKHFRRLADPEGTLALCSGWLGLDLAPYHLDDPLDVVPSDAIQSLAETFGDGDWRLRDVIDRLAPTPNGPLAVETGAEVADRIQEWIAATDADGLNLWHVITPGIYADFAEHVVPELQRRGVYRTRYDEGTLREKLFGRGPHLPPTHRRARYRRSQLAPGVAVGEPLGGHDTGPTRAGATTGAPSRTVRGGSPSAPASRS
jgi:hypothetical protein